MAARRLVRHTPLSSAPHSSALRCAKLTWPLRLTEHKQRFSGPSPQLVPRRRDRAKDPRVFRGLLVSFCTNELQKEFEGVGGLHQLRSACHLSGACSPSGFGSFLVCHRRDPPQVCQHGESVKFPQTFFHFKFIKPGAVKRGTRTSGQRLGKAVTQRDGWMDGWMDGLVRHF